MRLSGWPDTASGWPDTLSGWPDTAIEFSRWCDWQETCLAPAP